VQFNHIPTGDWEKKEKLMTSITDIFRKVFTGFRGTLLRYILITSIVPLLIATLMLYLVARNSIISTTEKAMINSTHHIKRMCEIQSEEIDKKAESDLEKAYRAAQTEFARYKDVSFSPRRADITVANQDTKEESKLDIPLLMSGNTTFNDNNGIVDAIAARIGMAEATSTIFQLYDEKLIRISTNVMTEEGTRAVSTYIPKDSLVYQTVASGKPYKGRAVVVGRWYVTHYEPILTRDKKVIGALYVGIPAPKTSIFDMIRETKIGNEGFVYIINSQGQFIEHPFLKGKNILNLKDIKTGLSFGKEMISKKEGLISYVYETTINGKTVDNDVVAYYTYFPKWDWIIASTAQYNDILKNLNIILYIAAAMVAGLSILLLFLGNYLVAKITGPFQTIISTAKQVSNGDLTLFIPQSHYLKCYEEKHCTEENCPAYNSRNRSCWRIEGTLCGNGQALPTQEEKLSQHCHQCAVYKHAVRNEMDELVEAINNMIVTIRRIVYEIQTMTNELNEGADRLANISEAMSNNTQGQAALIEETSSANEELIASIENIANAADQQAKRVSQTDVSMEELTSTMRLVGNNSMNVSKETQSTVEDAKHTGTMLQTTTESINQISENSKKIIDIVGIIMDISDKINLLSLNASIEAARAGENGRGFAVVAEEISKLADATARSTKDIESIISTNRHDIETGASLVNRMAGAITKMIGRIEEAAKLVEEIAISSDKQGQKSEQVMKDVEEVNNMATQIAQATSEQKTTSAEILDAVSRINESIQEVAGSAEILADLSLSIKEHSNNLKSITYRFIVEK
jgi:methyl-accepting chemotaxis protein